MAPDHRSRHPLPRAAPGSRAPAAGQRVGRRHRQGPRRGRLPGAGHHQRRPRRHPRSQGRQREPRRGLWPTRPTWWRATDLPVSADLENGFADAPDEVAETVRLAVEAGLAGCSIEDYDGSAIYDAGPRPGAGGRRGGGGARPAGAHRPGREPHPRRAGPRRHDRPAPVVPGGGGRRALRAGSGGRGRHPPGGRVGRPAGQRARPAGRPDRRRAGRHRRRAHLGRQRVHARRLRRARRRPAASCSTRAPTAGGPPPPTPRPWATPSTDPFPGLGPGARRDRVPETPCHGRSVHSTRCQ